MMSAQQHDDSPAMAVALAYHRAWTSKNVDEALRHVANDIVCDAPSGQLRGIDQYRPFLANFAPLVTDFDMIAALGDADTAILVYDLHTIPVSSGLTCECFTVRDGRITRNRLIFDQTPYIAARQQSG
jgi:ketosteroid isomerase-like protein